MLAAKTLLFCCLLTGFFNTILAAETKTVSIGETQFLAINVDPIKATLHWKDAQGKPYQYFSRLQNTLKKQGHPAEILMNAGIYSKGYNPAGLHIEQGKVLHQLNTNKGKGNFHIQPNGVFLITQPNKPDIVTTRTYQKYYQKKANRIRLATQSGPMLLINGKINPRFKKDIHSPYIRNGVCTTAKKKLYFIITNQGTSNLYTFAKAAKMLGCHNALYLDGSISKLYQRGRGIIVHFRPFVGILAVSK